MWNVEGLHCDRCLCFGEVGDSTQRTVTTKQHNIITRFYLVVVPLTIDIEVTKTSTRRPDSTQLTSTLYHNIFPPNITTVTTQLNPQYTVAPSLIYSLPALIDIIYAQLCHTYPDTKWTISQVLSATLLCPKPSQNWPYCHQNYS